MKLVKVYRRGDVLYREGDLAKSIFLIQSGSVHLYMTRRKQKITLCILGGTQIAGEHGLADVPVHPHTAICLADTEVLELPVKGVESQIGSANQLLKLLTKSLSRKLKLVTRELQSLRLDGDNTPCATGQTAKIFASIYFSANSVGTKSEDGVTTADWTTLKQFAARVFQEPSLRFENAVNILVKLGFASYEEIEGPTTRRTESILVHFTDLSIVERFFDFYQFNYYRGKTDPIRFDERILQLTSILCEVGKSAEQKERMVLVELNDIIDHAKENFGIIFNQESFNHLLKNSFSINRKMNEGRVFLEFEYPQTVIRLKIIQILQEIEKWNSTGEVDPTEEPEAVRKPIRKLLPECSSCGATYRGEPKFCSECGESIDYTAAAA